MEAKKPDWMDDSAEYVPVYGTPELDVYCIDGDRLATAGLGSGQSAGRALIKPGIGGIIERFRNHLRMSKLL